MPKFKILDATRFPTSLSRIDSGIWYKRVTKIETSTKTEQTLDQHRPQMGPIWPSGGGKGATENQHKYKKVKKQNAKTKMIFFLLRYGAIFTKIGGLNGWAFTAFFFCQQM